MSKGVNIHIPEKEQVKFSRWIKSLENKNQREVKTLVRSTILNIHKWAVRFAPVDYAILKSSIRPVFTSSGFGGSVRVRAKYGPYKEFGTGTKVFKQYGEFYAPDPEIRKYAAQFRGRGIRKVNMEAKPYLFPAFNLGVKEMTEKLKRMGFK